MSGKLGTMKRATFNLLLPLVLTTIPITTEYRLTLHYMEVGGVLSEPLKLVPRAKPNADDV